MRPQDQRASAPFDERFAVPVGGAVGIERGVNVRQRGVQREAMTLLAQGEGAVGVGGGVVAVGIPGQRGGYVIAGVVVGVHAPIDGEKIHLFGVHTGYGELRKIAIDGAVRVNQRVGVRVAGPGFRHVADAGNIQRTAQVGAVGGDDGAAVAVGQVYGQGAVRLLR